MPNFEVHRKIGALVALVLSLVFIIFVYKKLPLSGWKLILIWPVIFLYSNFPDYDHHLSKLRKKTLMFIFFIMVISTILSVFINIYILLVLLGLTGMMGLLMLRVKHRGPMHTYWLVFIASIPMLFLHWFLFVLAFLCSATHIFVDRLWSKTKRKVRKITDTQNQTKNYNFTFKL